MVIREKELRINNFITLDSRAEQRDSEISEFEESLIKKYLQDLFPNIKISEENIKLISSNFFYESYSLLIENKKYLLKISLDPENKKLSTENFCLDSVSDLISPKIVNYTKNTDHDIEFLLTTWENGESFDFYGIDDLIFNMGTFVCGLDFIHESDNSKLTSFEEKFEENESITSFINEIDSKELIIFEKLVDLNPEKLCEIFSKLKKIYQENYSEDISVLCHSNLKKSNILYQSEFIKFINFENAHKSDLYYSLLKSVNNLGLYFSAKDVQHFLKKYHEFSNLLKEVSLADFLAKYEEKKETNRLLLFQDLLHKILFHFYAYGAFNRCQNLVHYLNLYNNLRPTVEKHFPEYIKSFDKLFYTPIPSVKTYDMEELKMIAEMS
jgi:hypothetical protein